MLSAPPTRPTSSRRQPASSRTTAPTRPPWTPPSPPTGPASSTSSGPRTPAPRGRVSSEPAPAAPQSPAAPARRTRSQARGYRVRRPDRILAPSRPLSSGRSPVNPGAPTAPRPRVYTRAEQRHALTASFLGWTLDAFDFFILVFMMDRVAADLRVTKGAIVATLTATLALRPVGAVIFGMLADRYGRRRPLMANVIYFSLIEFGCGFAPNYTVFLVLRSLYGIGMGGEWGVGASLAMEIAPRRWRGVLSGILQSGYSIGYLLAAVCARVVLPAWGWRPMFWLGGVPALLALYIRLRVPESEAWQQNRAPTVGAILRAVAGHGRSFVYLIALMTLMMFLSHGTQDLYPDFLKTTHALAEGTVSSIAILISLGAVLGAIVFGQLSESGRRRSMIAALGLSLAMIPLWAFGHTLSALALG